MSLNMILSFQSASLEIDVSREPVLFIFGTIYFTGPWLMKYEYTVVKYDYFLRLY